MISFRGRRMESFILVLGGTALFTHVTNHHQPNIIFSRPRRKQIQLALPNIGNYQGYSHMQLFC